MSAFAEDFVYAGLLTQIPADGVFFTHVGERDIMLVRSGEKVLALGANCTHAFASLRDGRIEGTVITCLQHGARFDLTSGRALGGTCPNLPVYAVKMRGDQVFVKTR